MGRGVSLYLNTSSQLLLLIRREKPTYPAGQRDALLLGSMEISGKSPAASSSSCHAGATMRIDEEGCLSRPVPCLLMALMQKERLFCASRHVVASKTKRKRTSKFEEKVNSLRGVKVIFPFSGSLSTRHMVTRKHILFFIFLF